MRCPLPRCRSLEFYGCDLSPASVPALARLVKGGMLESLLIVNWSPLLNEAAALTLADALTANRALKYLCLCGVHFWDAAAAAGAIMQALTGHPSLHEVDLNNNTPQDQAAAGAALGALVVANTPALKVLSVDESRYGNDGLVPLFDALPRNNHLRKLSCRSTGMSEAFARDVVLPAVRANTSLRTLYASWHFRGLEHELGPLRWWRRRRWWEHAVADR